ncbi:proteoglycan 4a [Acanthochromis polyacanthus]|uniref:proteoglycan 4a n=1 Tax=Acanthochromis polyacanthus TaxID=80966 RepID=UPI0022348D94|nr:proteoglycan 4a [Acanthochromis polyacanthus]
MKMMMMKTSLGLLLLGLIATSAAAGPGSCSGRCGELYTRGQQCNCDYGCMKHNECCQDFEATCTIIQSCRGRCGETFRRGLQCECDPLCVQYNTCCPDYQLHCDASVSVPRPGSFQTLRASGSGKRKSDKSRKRSNSESEEWYSGRGRCSQNQGSQCQGSSRPLNPLTSSSSGSRRPAAAPTNQLQYGGNNIPPSYGGAPYSPAPGSFLPANAAFSQGNRAPYSPAPGSFLPANGGFYPGSGAPVSPSTPGGSRLNVHLVLSPGGAAPSGPGQGFRGPAGPRPSTLQDVAQALGLSVVDGGPAGPGNGFLSDVDLCSDSPINGLTALINGTILIFKGEMFWSVDPVSRSVSRPQSITDTLGISSPIDTVFTRLNCQGNTYIIKGDQFWRLDGNMVMEPGYPKPLTSEFPGLTGSISAALAVPATRTKPETVFFFKNGDVLQRFTFPPSNTPTCNPILRSPMKSRFTRQAEVLLSGEINIKVALKGFPTPVTSALSMASPLGNDRHQHYVFSGPLYFNVQISNDLPALARPDPYATLSPQPIFSPAAMATNPANMAAQNANPPQPPNSITVWLHCP